ncbi:MAG: DUF6152 family protein [Gammaproteobacteria bacterium]|jgi:hypothetical protein
MSRIPEFGDRAMSLTLFRRMLLVGTAVTCAAVPVLAHHSFASEFDREQPFRIEGAVNNIEWTNPHGWLHVDVQEDGRTVTYDIELASPSTLMRNGWRRNDLMPGDAVVITGYRARNRFHVGRATGISRATGEAIYGQGIDD